MIDCKLFFELLNKKGIRFYVGVPDSLLKNLCAYIADHADKNRHIVAANEGNAVALAAGYHLSTGEIGLVYMQNSGEGNAINPLTSLADPAVYGIPMLLIIGWRGKPGEKDEPQHAKTGKITLSLLDTLGIPYELLADNLEGAEKGVARAVNLMREKNMPFALVVPKETFKEYSAENQRKSLFELTREEAIKIVVNQLESTDVIISTTGKTSRELFEYRKELKHDHNKDFLTVGSMGHSSSIALGVALTQPRRRVYCLDGDGATIMHMGSLAVIGSCCPANFMHIIINNGSHDSVGGLSTAGFNIDIPEIAKACGYKHTYEAKTSNDVRKKLKILKSADGPSLLEIKVKKGARDDLGRPTCKPKENKAGFMEFMRNYCISTQER